jgi:hypothetical protein
MILHVIISLLVLLLYLIIYLIVFHCYEYIIVDRVVFLIRQEKQGIGNSTHVGNTTIDYIPGGANFASVCRSKS